MTTASIIVDGLLEVIVRHLDDLRAANRDAPGPVKASASENGRASAVVSLCAAVLESAATRIFYLNFRKENAGAEPDRTPSATSLLNEYLDSDLAREVAQLRKVRDAILHNHLWVGETVTNEAGRLVWAPGSPRLILSKEWRAQLEPFLDQSTRQTIGLRMNLNPMRVWRFDAYVAFGVLVKAFKALQEHDPTGYNIDSNRPPFVFNGENVTASEIAGSLDIPRDQSRATKQTKATPERSGTILLLGAGASVCAGMPLMLGLTEEVYARASAELEAQGLGLSTDAFERLIGAAKLLDGDVSRNLETLLRVAPSLVRLRPLFGADGSRLEIATAAAGFQCMVERAVCRILTDLRNPDHAGLHHVADLLRTVRDGQDILDVFSLNFDLCVEDACHSAGIPFTTGFGDPAGPAPRPWSPGGFDRFEAGVRLHKLHGSIRWRTFTELDQVHFSLGAHGIVEVDEPMAPLEMPEGVLSDQYEIGLFPFIKVPTSDPAVSLFARFLRALETAHTCVVVGCSYGDGDGHIKQALGRARADGMFWVNVNKTEPISHVSEMRGIDRTVLASVEAPECLPGLAAALDEFGRRRALPRAGWP
jgi:hypothetical protein